MADFGKSAKTPLFGFFYHRGQFLGHFSRDYTCKFFRKKVKKWPKNGPKNEKKFKVKSFIKTRFFGPKIKKMTEKKNFDFGSRFLFFKNWKKFRSVFSDKNAIFLTNFLTFWKHRNFSYFLSNSTIKNKFYHLFFLKKIRFFWPKFLQAIHIKLFILHLFIEKISQKWPILKKFRSVISNKNTIFWAQNFTDRSKGLKGFALLNFWQKVKKLQKTPLKTTFILQSLTNFFRNWSNLVNFSYFFVNL